MHIRGHIRVMSINSLYNGKLHEVHAYSTAVRAYVEQQTRCCRRFTGPCVISFVAYFPELSQAVDCDNVIIKPFVDGLKKYVLYNKDDNMLSVKEVRIQCRIGSEYEFELNAHEVT